MTYAYEATPSHDEIAKHINKALGKRLTGEQVAMVLEGAKDFRVTAKDRAAEAKEAKRVKKIADLKAQLAALGADDADPEPEVATVTPIKKATAPPAKKAAAPKTGAAKKTAAAAADKAKREKVSEEEADIARTPEGAEPIVVDVSEDGFETVGGEQTTDDSDWDDAFGPDTDEATDDAEDF